MKIRIRIHVVLAIVACLGWRSLSATTIARAQDVSAPSGPDPREIPIPRIKTPLGILPGVKDLPVRKEMPDVMIMNDGTKVTTRTQWEKRREEMKRILEYYAVGEMPPPPGNVKGKRNQVGDRTGWRGEIPPGSSDLRSRRKALAGYWGLYAGQRRPISSDHLAKRLSSWGGGAAATPAGTQPGSRRRCVDDGGSGRHHSGGCRVGSDANC